MHQNNVYDLTVSLLYEACHNVKVEPILQSLITGKALRCKTAVCEDSTHIFDACVFNSLALFNTECYLPHASMNKRSAMHMKKEFEKHSETSLSGHLSNKAILL